jgi:hypothetical protein
MYRNAKLWPQFSSRFWTSPSWCQDGIINCAPRGARGHQVHFVVDLANRLPTECSLMAWNGSSCRFFFSYVIRQHKQSQILLQMCNRTVGDSSVIEKNANLLHEVASNTHFGYKFANREF